MEPVIALTIHQQVSNHRMAAPASISSNEGCHFKDIEGPRISSVQPVDQYEFNARNWKHKRWYTSDWIILQTLLSILPCWALGWFGFGDFLSRRSHFLCFLAMFHAKHGTYAFVRCWWMLGVDARCTTVPAYDTLAAKEAACHSTIFDMRWVSFLWPPWSTTMTPVVVSRG